MALRSPAFLATLTLLLPLASSASDLECPEGTRIAKGKSEEGYLADWCENARGERHGPFVAYREGGKTVIRAGYADGKLQGGYESWFANGNREKSGEYDKGELDGEWTRWHENGRTRDVVEWDHGRPDGSWEAWHSNGERKAKGEFRLGKEAGEWTYWREDGSREKRGYYADGKQVCDWRFWDVGGAETRRDFPAAEACGSSWSWRHLSIGTADAGFTQESGQKLGVSATFVAVHPMIRLTSLLHFRGSLGLLMASGPEDHSGGGFLAFGHVSAQFWYLFLELGGGAIFFPGEGTKIGPSGKFGLRFPTPLFGIVERIEIGGGGWGDPSTESGSSSDSSGDGLGFLAIGIAL